MRRRWTRPTRVRVLPEPGPASTSTGFGPAWMAFCCASEYGNAFGSGGVWGAGGVIAAEQGHLFRCRFLGRCRFGFSARLLGFGQSIQQGGRTIPSGHKLFALFFREHFDDPVFAVKARFLDDVAPAHTGHGLAEGVPVLTQIRLGDRVQNIHFRTNKRTSSDCLSCTFRLWGRRKAVRRAFPEAGTARRIPDRAWA